MKIAKYLGNKQKHPQISINDLFEIRKQIYMKLMLLTTIAPDAFPPNQ